MNKTGKVLGGILIAAIVFVGGYFIGKSAGTDQSASIYGATATKVVGVTNGSAGSAIYLSTDKNCPLGGKEDASGREITGRITWFSCVGAAYHTPSYVAGLIKGGSVGGTTGPTDPNSGTNDPAVMATKGGTGVSSARFVATSYAGCDDHGGVHDMAIMGGVSFYFCNNSRVVAPSPATGR